LGLVIIQIGFVAITIIQNRRRQRFNRSVFSPFDQVDTLAEANAIDEGKIIINSDMEPEPGLCHLCQPRAKFPYNIMLFIVRIVILGWALWTLILLFNEVIQDRIMAPCSIPWDS
jgi:hypothetical protein